MIRRPRLLRTMVGIGATLVLASCGGSASTGGSLGASPTLEQMCPAPATVALVAYDRRSGAYRWSACSTDAEVRRVVFGVTDAAVYVDLEGAGGVRTVEAYARKTGKRLADGGPKGDQPDRADLVTAPVVDGARIEGGQDDPLNVYDAATGALRFTATGRPAYDDVWAVGDGAVFLDDRGSVVAYELSSGAERWRTLSGPTEMRLPWYVDGKDLFAMWTNVYVVATTDGSTRWHTSYATADFPHMTGVRADADTVYVSFSSVRSGGD